MALGCAISVGGDLLHLVMVSDDLSATARASNGGAHVVLLGQSCED